MFERSAGRRPAERLGLWGLIEDAASILQKDRGFVGGHWWKREGQWQADGGLGSWTGLGDIVRGGTALQGRAAVAGQQRHLKIRQFM